MGVISDIPHFDFDTSEKYKEALLKLREEEKGLIKSGKAILSTIDWVIRGSAA